MAKSNIANSGHEQTISEVLVAVVKSIAAFSARKYTEPPVMPSTTISSSSRQLSQKSRKRRLVRAKANSSTEAMMKRSVKICAGDKPFWSSNFVKTKVLPQMATTIKATK